MTIVRNIFLILILTITTYSKDSYNRDDYNYNSTKARKYFISFYDPYSGKTFYKSDDMEIDHIVPLSLAHKWGAYLWTTQEKKAFANDIENLIMVSKVCNRIKGKKPPSEWMPKNIGYHVEYKKRFNYILQKYKLED